MTQFRAHARHSLDQRVTLRVGTAREREATIENVGFGGARLRMAAPPAVGTIVRLSIATATAWEPLQLDAIVRWHGAEPGETLPFGVELAPLAPKAALALDEWIETLVYEAPTSRAR